MFWQTIFNLDRKLNVVTLVYNVITYPLYKEKFSPCKVHHHQCDYVGYITHGFLYILLIIVESQH